MTRERSADTQALREALEALAQGGMVDLRTPGFQEALHSLRQADPARARQVERTLEPFLRERVFARREMAWQETSEGTRARLALLPHNPHLRQDVDAVRAVLRG